MKIMIDHKVVNKLISFSLILWDNLIILTSCLLVSKQRITDELRGITVLDTINKTLHLSI